MGSGSPPLGSTRKKPRFVVTSSLPLPGSTSSELTSGGLPLGSTIEAALEAFGARAVLRPAAGQRDERQGQRLPHAPACASSHSARLVKPTMIASIQYCERTASLGFG